MHPTAMQNCQSFFDTYASAFLSRPYVRVVEIGSQNVNGTLRDTCPPSFEYVGVDFQKAKGVDVVLDDPYSLPFEDNSVDIVLSSSCFEHSEMFWLVFLEIMRVLKPDGLFYLNAPSAGSFHRYPVDCWRFYPDSGKALVQWARKSGTQATMLESFIQKGGNWHDYVCVFLKNETYSEKFSNRILKIKKDFENGQILGHEGILNLAETSQNEINIQGLQEQLASNTPIEDHQNDQTQIQAIQIALTHANTLKQQLENELACIQKSMSWKITVPFRRFKAALKNIFK